MSYHNKTVLITGAYRGIGREIIEFFAKEGANIIMTYHNNKNLTINFADELIREYHVRVDYMYLDLCDENTVVDLFDFVKEKYGKIDFLINNAALNNDCFVTYKIKIEFMKVLETNVVGTFLMMKYFDNIIDDGFIFNMASTDGIDTGSIYSVDYNASKAAVINLTKTMSLYSKNRIICLCPNWVNTESTQEMDQVYLQNEMERIHQKALISPETIVQVMKDCIETKEDTGSIIRIDGDDDVRKIDW